MASTIYIIRVRNPRDYALVTMGPASVEFRRCWDHAGNCVMGAVIQPDHPHYAMILRQASALPSYEVHTTNPILSWEDPMAVEPSGADLQPDAAGNMAGPVLAAMRNGWTADDMAGAGIGDLFDERGGRAEATGLTMAELALCKPPEKWDEMRGKAYPWEAPGWAAPGIAWKPPVDLAKQTGPDGPQDSEEEPLAPVLPESDQEPAGGDEAPAAEASEPPVEPEKPAAKKGDPDLVAFEVAMAEYKGDAMQALRFVAALIEESNGQIPNHSKIRYHFGKHDLPSPKKAEYEALIAAAR